MKNDDFEKEYKSQIKSLYASDNFIKMKGFIQHGNTSCFYHSLAVAYFSLRLMKLFGIKCDAKSLIRGALLHDYFLYDWHIDENKEHPLHGFHHPRAAYVNAIKEFNINPLEKNIIVRHMFPLTLVPPKYKESIVVCLVDKYCSIIEIIKRNPYKNSFIMNY